MSKTITVQQAIDRLSTFDPTLPLYLLDAGDEGEVVAGYDIKVEDICIEEGYEDEDVDNKKKAVTIQFTNRKDNE